MAGVFDNVGDWAGDFFTGDWKNAYEANPYLTAGVPALAATVATAGLAGPAAFGAMGAAEGATALGAAEGASAFGATEAGVGAGEAFGGVLGGDAAATVGAEGAAGNITGLTGADTLTGAATEGGSGISQGAQSGGQGGFLDKLWTGAKSSVTSNPLGIAAAGVGLGMNMLKGNPTDPNQQKLQDSANQLGAQGQALQQYLANGTLPPGMKAQVDQANAAAKARIVANHAKNGMPTDPSQNSALAQELNAVDMNSVAATAQAQLDMMKTGLSETGLSTQLYEMLVKMDRQNNQDLMGAITSFASALGGSRNVTLQLPKAA